MIGFVFSVKRGYGCRSFAARGGCSADSVWGVVTASGLSIERHADRQAFALRAVVQADAGAMEFGDLQHRHVPVDHNLEKGRIGNAMKRAIITPLQSGVMTRLSFTSGNLL